MVDSPAGRAAVSPDDTFSTERSDGPLASMQVLWVSLLIVGIDQLAKLWVRTSMYVGESIPVLGSWLRLTFTQNPGMAFGIDIGSTPLVTTFAILATLLIIAYLWKLRRGPFAYRLSIAVVLGGAIGNIIDRVFYGTLFSYGTYFHGQVVDFIHVDVWRGTVAEWIPLIGGSTMALFPIWNVADMAIVLGVVAMLVIQHTHLEYEESSRTGSGSEGPDPDTDVAPDLETTSEQASSAYPDEAFERGAQDGEFDGGRFDGDAFGEESGRSGNA